MAHSHLVPRGVHSVSHVVPIRSVPIRSDPFRSDPIRSVLFRSVPFRSDPIRSVPFRSVPRSSDSAFPGELDRGVLRLAPGEREEETTEETIALAIASQNPKTKPRRRGTEPNRIHFSPPPAPHRASTPLQNHTPRDRTEPNRTEPNHCPRPPRRRAPPARLRGGGGHSQRRPLLL